IVKPGFDGSQVVTRFEAERQTLAMMSHPHIAQVFDAGATDTGRPYFVMELVQGIPITDFCDNRSLSPKERLALFLPICRAIHHAHQKGVIHRDIKPSNVLVDLEDGNPVPKVIDFGIAKLTDESLTERAAFTQIGQVLGTLEYMSPEQASKDGRDVDTRSDIYSLGVLLYELLTGTTPLADKDIREAGFVEALQTVREHEPPKPSSRISNSSVDQPDISARRQTDPKKLSSMVRGELDWIVMKALDKERARRYDSASAFAMDIERFLNNESVEACPPSLVYRLSKFMIKHRVAAGFILLATLSLVLITAGSMWAAVHFNRQEILQRHLAIEREQERDRAFRKAYLADMRVAQQDLESGQLARLHELLARYLPQDGQPDLRGWEWYYLLGRTWSQHETLADFETPVQRVAWRPDGRQIAAGVQGLGIQIHNPHEKTELHTLDDVPTAFAWSHDGRFFATCNRDRQVHLRDGESMEIVHTFGPYTHSMTHLAWSPDDTLISAHDKGMTTVLNSSDGSTIEIIGLGGTPLDSSWSPDGSRLVIGNDQRNPRTGGLLNFLSPSLALDIVTSSYSPVGSLLAFGSLNGDLVVLDYLSDKPVATSRLPGTIHALAWSKDGQALLASGGGE
ncbi:MAG: WD40 repeat domain-containing serine/threonine protein kinase, partial [Verrucomicrobiota bacterium]